MIVEVAAQIGVVLMASVGSGVVTGAVTLSGVRTNIDWIKQQQRDHKELITTIEEWQRTLDRRIEQAHSSATRAHTRIDTFENGNRKQQEVIK